MYNFFVAFPYSAAHIIGGEMLYAYNGPGLTNTSEIHDCTFKLFAISSLQSRYAHKCFYWYF